jgi:regulatory protein YycH of two-component signal transduction system YycFG
MDKVIKAVQLLTLVLISLVCLTYIWRQYYDYKKRDEAWAICAKWSYDEAKILSRSETLLIQECMQRIKP